MSDEDRYLSLGELVTYSGLSLRTLYRYLDRAAHPIPAFRIGGRVLVRRRDFDRWVEEEHGAPHQPVSESARVATAMDARVAAAVKRTVGH